MSRWLDGSNSSAPETAGPDIGDSIKSVTFSPPAAVKQAETPAIKAAVKQAETPAIMAAVA